MPKLILSAGNACNKCKPMTPNGTLWLRCRASIPGEQRDPCAGMEQSIEEDEPCLRSMFSF